MKPAIARHLRGLEEALALPTPNLVLIGLVNDFRREPLEEDPHHVDHDRWLMWGHAMTIAYGPVGLDRSRCDALTGIPTAETLATSLTVRPAIDAAHKGLSLVLATIRAREARANAPASPCEPLTTENV